MSCLGGDLPPPTDTGHAYGPQRIIQIVKEQPTNTLFPVRSKRPILLYIRPFVKPKIGAREAKREIVRGKWKRVRIEFEFESRNFKEHRHDLDGCDVIVCWRHNWADCPERIEVVELERVVR